MPEGWGGYYTEAELEQIRARKREAIRAVKEAWDRHRMEQATRDMRAELAVLLKDKPPRFKRETDNGV